MPRRTGIKEEKARLSPQHGGGQRLVSRQHRTAEECRSALAAADDLPPGRNRQAATSARSEFTDATTEFEISAQAAEPFSVKLKRPDKEENIRIEALAAAPQGQAAPEKPSHAPGREGGQTGRGPRQNDNFVKGKGRSNTANLTA